MPIGMDVVYYPPSQRDHPFAICNSKLAFPTGPARRPDHAAFDITEATTAKDQADDALRRARLEQGK